MKRFHFISVYDNGLAKGFVLRKNDYKHKLIPLQQMGVCLQIQATLNSRRVAVSYKRKYVHEVLFNCLLKLSQEKSVGR